MLSRRAVIAGDVSSLAAPPRLARAQSSPDGPMAAPTILRLERRDIEVNGKAAPVYGIRQPNETSGGRSTATCSTTSRQACSRRSDMCDARGRGHSKRQ